MLRCAERQSECDARWTAIQNDVILPTLAKYQKEYRRDLFTNTKKQITACGMTEKDIGFVKKTTKLSGNPLVDVAHFLYTGRSQGGLGEDGKQLSNLSFLCPQLGKRIEEVNPFLGASWKKYSELFNLKILDPSNPKFVGEMLQEKADALKFSKLKS